MGFLRDLFSNSSRPSRPPPPRLQPPRPRPSPPPRPPSSPRPTSSPPPPFRRDRDETKLIAVMGSTGCGKTTFVNLVAGACFEVGHTLESCTKEIQHHSFSLGGELVTLIDTPGTDDSVRPQADVLKEIAAFLKSSYESGKQLAGLLYLHPISDNRMGGVAVQNYRLFRKICGDAAMENVIFVTNMWDEVSLEIGAKREQELQERYFKDAMARGARMCRHDGTLVSAQHILLDILHKDPRILQIQDEMVERKMLIPETTVGREFELQLDEEIERRQQEVDALISQVNARLKDVEELRVQRKRLDEIIKQVETQREKLRTRIFPSSARNGPHRP